MAGLGIRHAEASVRSTAMSELAKSPESAL
jgi:hypothetical protein